MTPSDSNRSELYTGRDRLVRLETDMSHILSTLDRMLPVLEDTASNLKVITNQQEHQKDKMSELSDEFSRFNDKFEEVEIEVKNIRSFRRVWSWAVATISSAATALLTNFNDAILWLTSRFGQN